MPGIMLRDLTAAMRHVSPERIEKVEGERKVLLETEPGGRKGLSPALHRSPKSVPNHGWLAVGTTR